MNIKLIKKESPFICLSSFGKFSIGEKVYISSKNKPSFKNGEIIRILSKEFYEVLVQNKFDPTKFKLKKYKKNQILKKQQHQERNFDPHTDDLLFMKQMNEANLLENLSEKFNNNKIYDFLMGKILINLKPDNKAKKKHKMGEAKRIFNSIIKSSTMKNYSEKTFNKDNNMIFDNLLIMGINHADKFEEFFMKLEQIVNSDFNEDFSISTNSTFFLDPNNLSTNANDTSGSYFNKSFTQFSLQTEENPLYCKNPFGKGLNYLRTLAKQFLMSAGRYESIEATSRIFFFLNFNIII